MKQVFLVLVSIYEIKNMTIQLTEDTKERYRLPIFVKNTNLEWLLYIPHSNTYIPQISSLLDHVITNTKLTDTDKLVFLHIYSISFFNNRTNGRRTIASPLRNISQKLNVSKAQVFKSQHKLEQLGLVSIKRQRNRYNQRKPNLITPCIPNDVFITLNKAPNRFGVDIEVNKQESNLDYLERTKQFINFNYGILKFILEHDQLTPACKILSIDLFTMWYKYHVSSNRVSNFQFLVNYQQLISKHNCSLKTISSNLIKLEKVGIVSRKQIFTKNGEERNARHDKSIWEITFNFPKWYKDMQAPSKLHTDTLHNESIEDELFDSSENDYQSCSKTAGNLEELSQNDQNIVDELIDKLKEFKNSIPSFSKFPINFSKKNIENSSNICTKTVDDSDNLPVPSNTDGQAICSKSGHGMSFKWSHYNRENIIKTFKSNLRKNSKVIFDKFLDKIGLSFSDNIDKKDKAFSISKELVRRRTNAVSWNLAEKARKYAYALSSRKLAKGYAASLDKHELAKQLIIHITSWKPTKLGELSRKQEVDTALAVAWKSIALGTWQAPLEYAKAQILDYEFFAYRDKYRHSDILSPELKNLEIETDKLFGGYSNLTDKIKEEVEIEARYQPLEQYKPERVNPFDDEIVDAYLELEKPDQDNSNAKLGFTPISELITTIEHRVLTDRGNVSNTEQQTINLYVGSSSAYLVTV